MLTPCSAGGAGEAITGEQVEGEDAGAEPDRLEDEQGLGARPERVEGGEDDEQRVEVGGGVIADAEERGAEEVAVDGVPEEVVVDPEVVDLGPDVPVIDEGEAGEHDAVAAEDRDDEGEGEPGREAAGCGEQALAGAEGARGEAVDAEGDEGAGEGGVEQGEVGVLALDLGSGEGGDEGQSEQADEVAAEALGVGGEAERGLAAAVTAPGDDGEGADEQEREAHPGEELAAQPRR
jgi:hypothetical protein